MVFAWDEQKEIANKRKHGISFETATRVFADPDAVSYLDRIVDGEDRWHTVGLVGSIWILLVVHTLRVNYEEEVRIISARKATPSERNLYNPSQ